MNTSKIFQIYFTSPLHISDVRADYGKSEKKIHSDTLTAAIMYAWAALGKEEWIQKEYGFTVSSLFPFTKIENHPVYFFPKPFLSVDIDGDVSTIFKKLKKIEYLDWQYFKKVCSAESLNSRKLHDACKGTYLTDQAIDKAFIYTTLKSRIVKSRNEHQDSTPFYMEQINFKNNSGLWGAVVFDNPDGELRFNVALNYLKDSGIGTDRNTGNGQFAWEWDNETNFDFSLESEYALNLSLFCPENHTQLDAMLKDETVRYETIKRGGWISEPFNSIRKKSVLMFTEGSIFKSDASIKGQLVSLQPKILKSQNQIWRSGKSLFLPVKL